MSKMTQRRMARRATRKLGETRRKNRRLHVEVCAAKANLDQAFKALRRALGREEVAPATTPAQS